MGVGWVLGLICQGHLVLLALLFSPIGPGHSARAQCSPSAKTHKHKKECDNIAARHHSALLCFSAPSLKESEHVLTFTFSRRWSEPNVFLSLSLFFPFARGTQMLKQKSRTIRGRREFFDGRRALTSRITIITEFRKLHHFRLLCTSIQAARPFSFGVIKFIFS